MKKRVIAFILVLVFALPLFSVPAYAKYDGEILFRDISWGSNYYEVMEGLKDLGVENWRFWEQLRRLDVAATKKALDLCYYSKLEAPDILGFNIALDPNKSHIEVPVAGLSLSNIFLYFAYTLPEDESLPDIEDTAFYGASYIFKNDLSDDTSESLHIKLRALYGEETETDYSSRIAWYGENGTYIFLQYDNTAVLTYLWEGVDAIESETLAYLKDYYKEHPGNVDGL